MPAYIQSEAKILITPMSGLLAIYQMGSTTAGRYVDKGLCPNHFL